MTDYIMGSSDGFTMSAIADNGSDTVYAGGLITITMRAVYAMTISGQPALLLNDNEAATYVSGSGTNALTFAYTVKQGDHTANLQVIGIGGPNGASVDYLPVHYGGSGTQSSAGSDLFFKNYFPSSINTHDLHIQVYTGATSVQQEVMGLYAALYGRAPEVSGFSFWIGLVGQQPDAADLAIGNSRTTHITLADAAMLGQNFVNSQSAFFDATYGKMTDSQFVNAMYQNIGGNAGDPGGVGFWTNLLADVQAHGQSVQVARASIAGLFVDALIGFDTTNRPGVLTDQQWTDALTRTAAINNKIVVSSEYTNASARPSGDILIPHGVNDAAYQAAVAVLQSVTSDPNTAAVAIAGINNAVAHHDLSLI